MSENLFPGTTGRVGTSFEQIGPFVNPSLDSFKCVEVEVDPGSCVHPTSGQVLVHVSAYLDDFNPARQRDNYAGSVGNPQEHTAFFFELPPGRAFYAVGRQVYTADGTSSDDCQFSVTTYITGDCG